MKENKWIGRICKTVFWLTAFMLVIFTVLFNLGGSNETYESTIEQYISESTGYAADIHKFNAMTFFPSLGIDFEGLELRVNPDDPSPVAGADRVTLSFDFWDAAFSTGKINNINIENFYALPGVVLGKPVQIEKAAIENYGNGPAIFRVEGHIGEHDIQAETDMEVFGEDSSAKYKFGQNNRLLLVVGEARMEATIQGEEDGTHINGFKATLQGAEVISGTGLMTGQRGENLRLTGDFSAPENGTLLKPDLRFEFGHPMRIRGSINSPGFYTADFAEGSRVRNFADYLNAVFASEMPSRFTADSKVTLMIEKLHDGTYTRSSVEKTFESKNAPVNIKSLHGFITALPDEIRKAAP